MSAPIELDMPHTLGKAAARARLEGGLGRLAEHVPGGVVTEHSWAGDTLSFTVAAMGQSVKTRLDVFDDRVHAVIDLPGLLGLFAGPIRAALQREGPKLLK